MFCVSPPSPTEYVVLVSVAVIVTAPVAPLIDTLEPATIDVTPELLNVVELNDNPVPALYVVFVSVGACLTSASCVNPSITYMALTARAVNYAISELNKRNL